MKIRLKKISTAYSKLLAQTKRVIDRPTISDAEKAWMLTRPVKYRKS